MAQAPSLWRYALIITNIILNLLAARRACGLSAGMMIISPALTWCGRPEMVISALPSKT